jgi:tRNA(Ile)-lysidine synthase
MAGSRKSKPAEQAAAALIARTARHLDGVVKAGDRVVVGLSGGVDSVALLDILAALARRRRFALSAFHVNHQLSPNAARWAAFCRRLCRSRGIRLRSVKVVVPRGEGVEAAARRARYEAFARLPADFVALAHNQDDQAETLLLQLLRGAGVKGLAAMPLLRAEAAAARQAGRSAPAILRPLLDVPRSEIERHARSRGLEWIEDESNADTRYARNFLRREVLPLLAARFPAWRTTFARSAQHLAEAASLLDELAGLDAGNQQEEGVLAVAALRTVSHARARNLLRWFIGRHGAPMPNADRLEEALRQLLTAAQDARVCIDLGTHQLRRYAGRAYLVPMLPAPPAGYMKSWNGEPTLKLPELGGVLRMKPGRGYGLSLARLQRGPVTVRVRKGGETLRPDARRPSHSLKHLLQEAGVPPWQRGRLPLLYCGAQLVWAPGLGTAVDFQAARGEAAVRPEWRRTARDRLSGT